jgi:predicted RNA-binding protein YlqC (UPF0109 family)
MVKKLSTQAEQVSLLRDLLATMVESIVEHIDQVSYDDKVVFDRYVVGVMVATSDMGLILGRDGQTADSIRQVLWAACKKTSLHIDVLFKCPGQDAVALKRR